MTSKTSATADHTKQIASANYKFNSHDLSAHRPAHDVRANRPHSSTSTPNLTHKARPNGHVRANHPRSPYCHVDIEKHDEGLRGASEQNSQASLGPDHTDGMNKDDAKSKQSSNSQGTTNNSGGGRQDNQPKVVVKTGPKATA